jgi:hypothetical protein
MIVGHRGANDNRAYPFDMTRIVPGEHHPTRAAYIRRARRAPHIRIPVASRDRYTAAPRDESKGTHPGAGNPHEVHRARVVGGEEPH